MDLSHYTRTTHNWVADIAWLGTLIIAALACTIARGV